MCLFLSPRVGQQLHDLASWVKPGSITLPIKSTIVVVTSQPAQSYPQLPLTRLQNEKSVLTLPHAH